MHRTVRGLQRVDVPQIRIASCSHGPGASLQTLPGNLNDATYRLLISARFPVFSQPWNCTSCAGLCLCGSRAAEEAQAVRVGREGEPLSPAPLSTALCQTLPGGGQPQIYPCIFLSLHCSN